MNPDRQGLLLFAHGARDPQWALPFEAVAEHARRARPHVPVRLAYLDFMSPDIGSAAEALIGEGCARIDVVPLFLGAGGHVRRDLPLLLDTLRERHPGVVLRLHPAVGEQDAVIEAMARTALACGDLG